MTTPASTEPTLEDFEHHYADVNGTHLHYVTGGSGEPLVLLPGWPQTWWQFHKIMPALAERYEVIAVDYRGMGSSDKPEAGYDKKTMARDVYELVRHLGHERVHVAGEDIGAMVAYAYAFAANHPDATRKLALWEVGHPGDVFNELRMLPQPGQPHLWWFAFNQVDDLPEKLLAGRYRLLIDYLIGIESTDPDAIDEASRNIYAAAHEQPGAVRASNAWYQTFGQDIEDARAYDPLRMPVLGLGGMNFGFVPALLEGKATDVRYVEMKGAGHYLSQERPEELTRELLAFLG
ncbi:hydrolase [Streptomyces capoamus]|uniref:Hydrolase n=1 Tax=Streptomyces capoamus TaxID=68183 RepID=A0A919F2I8_9ACTN|nr:alpha/beta hydrolase [Streptomyces capoamus]GGW13582.1 hydrolase [Streptomyces libani subsp. rufus]GHG73856.1 hydrolase [Streptomyces capoamus]